VNFTTFEKERVISKGTSNSQFCDMMNFIRKFDKIHNVIKCDTVVEKEHLAD